MRVWSTSGCPSGTQIGSSSRRWSPSRRTGSPCPSSTTTAIAALLRSGPRIALVGASSHAIRPSNGVMRSLRAAGYDVVAVNPRETEIDGLPCYPTVAAAVEATGPVDIVDVFRRADLCVEHAREAVAVGARCLWLQLGHRERGGRTDRPRGGSGRRHGPLHDRRAPARRARLSGCDPGILARSLGRPPARPAPRPGGPDAADPPPRRARRLRAGRAPARRPEPRDPDRGPVRRRPRGQPARHVAPRPARVHGHGRRRPGVGPDDDDGRPDHLDRGRGAADARRDDVHPRRDDGRLRADRDRRRGRGDGGRRHRRASAACSAAARRRPRRPSFDVVLALVDGVARRWASRRTSGRW